MAAVFHHDILAAIAKRLPIHALVKFAQVNTATNDAAREAWQTWEAGCRAMGTRRMFSDKCWMDAYTRKVRQNAFRFIDASPNWSKLHDVPEPIATALRACLSVHLKLASLKYCIRADFEVLNVLCIRENLAWATISSTGEVWQFTDALPMLEVAECGALSLFLREIKEVIFKERVHAVAVGAPKKQPAHTKGKHLVKPNTSLVRKRQVIIGKPKPVLGGITVSRKPSFVKCKSTFRGVLGGQTSKQ